MVDIDLLQPEVGTDLLATASDLDESVNTAVADGGFQWYRAKVDAPATTSLSAHIARLNREWEAISGATEADGTYTPTPDDVGKFLLVRAAYSDGFTPARYNYCGRWRERLQGPRVG